MTGMTTIIDQADDVFFGDAGGTTTSTGRLAPVAILPAIHPARRDIWSRDGSRCDGLTMTSFSGFLPEKINFK